LTARHPEIQWADIGAFRNNAVHAYFSTDWEIVWVAGTMNAVVLGQQIAGILADEFPESDR